MTFQITSNTVNLTDPCYESNPTALRFNPSVGQYNVPAKSGTWFVEVGYNDNHAFGTAKILSEFTVYHEDYTGEEDWEELDGVFGVDSGQFGIFDTSIYVGDGDYENLDSFYRRCCDATHNKDNDNQCGVVDNAGFVSRSGYGDGMYAGFGAFNSERELIAFYVPFILDKEEWLENEDLED